MAVNWTGEQLAAIDTRGCGIVVPAAAGSGKTAVLIERVVRLLESGCPSETLLAVTFTKDAANQMKTKLSSALADRIVKETSPEKKKLLERQREMLPLAKICTIDSFCFELVNSNLNEFDYRNGIKICDESQVQALFDEAAAAALEQLRQDYPKYALILSDAFSGSSDKALIKQLKLFHDFVGSLAFPDEWLKKMSSNFSDTQQINKLADIFMYEMGGHVQKAMIELQRQRAVAMKIPNNAELLAVCNDDEWLLGKIAELIEDGSYTELYDFVVKPSYTTMRSPSDKGLDPVQIIDKNNAFKQLQKIREKLKDNVSKISKEFKRLGRDIVKPMKMAGRVYAALVKAHELVDSKLTQRLTELSLARFSDIERMAVRLLVSSENGRHIRTPLAESLISQHLYRVLLIDEYQDVNDLQETIIRALSDSPSPDEYGSDVFIVGDVKQSIYRFRLSNPQLFINAVRAAEDEDNTLLKTIRLTKNFRSRKCVIDTVNRFFSVLMSEELGDVDYSGAERLVKGAAYKGEDRPTQVMIVKDGDLAEDMPEYADFSEEELALARHIKQRIIQKETVFDGGALRPCRPEDFCLLSINHDACRRMTAALRYVGLSADSEQTDGYMRSREIMLMLDLLRVIDNPMRDMPMAAVMLSSILGFTDDEAARIRLLGGTDKNSKRFWQTILAISKDEDSDKREAEKIEAGDKLIEEKCRAAVRLIKHLRSCSVSMSLEALINKIYDETDMFAAASTYTDSKQRRANLRLLTQLAAEYEKDSSGGIAGFLRFFESVRRSGSDFKQALISDAGGGCVSVKTIHSSKGLEYNFVYLFGLSTNFNFKDLKGRLLFSEQYGAGIKFMKHSRMTDIQTVSHRAIYTIIKGESLSEKMRLFYVALTRARERLCISLYLKRSESGRFDMRSRLSDLADELSLVGSPSPRVLKRCSTFAEWTAAALMFDNSNTALLKALDREYLADVLAAAGAAYNADKPIFEYIFPPAAADGEGAKTHAAAAAADPIQVKQLLKKYEFVYGKPDAHAPTKRSVTEIVSELRERENPESDTMFYPQLGSLKEESDRLTAAQRGTFTHLFMELADYDAAQRSVEDELARLTEQGRFTPREAKGVYVSAVKKFFESPFYERMKASREVKREVKFMVRADDAGISDDEQFKGLIAADGMLQGVCDCLFKENDGYVLVDYKTDRFGSKEEMKKYSVQLRLYKAAMDLILPLPVKACYIYSFALADGEEIML